MGFFHIRSSIKWNVTKVDKYLLVRLVNTWNDAAAVSTEAILVLNLVIMVINVFLQAVNITRELMAGKIIWEWLNRILIKSP
ncbi:hypothetical protein BDV32DRAFT_128289 [Aspergillus pseudonomiae]|nr:hypothetical protein BDV32DRAFT_128289 [Aspergillus pseudonomiae]